VVSNPTGNKIFILAGFVRPLVIADVKTAEEALMGNVDESNFPFDQLPNMLERTIVNGRSESPEANIFKVLTPPRYRPCLVQTPEQELLLSITWQLIPHIASSLNAILEQGGETAYHLIIDWSSIDADVICFLSLAQRSNWRSRISTWVEISISMTQDLRSTPASQAVYNS
jgi:hypothetical protein